MLGRGPVQVASEYRIVTIFEIIPADRFPRGTSTASNHEADWNVMFWYPPDQPGTAAASWRLPLSIHAFNRARWLFDQMVAGCRAANSQDQRDRLRQQIL